MRDRLQEPEPSQPPVGEELPEPGPGEHVVILPDEEEKISRQINAYLEKDTDLIITTNKP